MILDYGEMTSCFSKFNICHLRWAQVSRCDRAPVGVVGLRSRRGRREKGQRTTLAAGGAISET